LAQERHPTGAGPQRSVKYNLSVDAAHTYFVGNGQWLVHNACLTLPASVTFKRGQVEYVLEQGDTKNGWKHIYDRHIDPMAATKYADAPDMFDQSLKTSDILELLGKTLKHGKTIGSYYGQTIIELRINFKGTGYQTYRVTLNQNSNVIRTFHPATQPLTNPKVVKK
jgi:hypothetical protein